jgi:hypothetical protein
MMQDDPAADGGHLVPTRKKLQLNGKIGRGEAASSTCAQRRSSPVCAHRRSGRSPPPGAFATTYKGSYGGDACAIKVLSPAGGAGKAGPDSEAQRLFFREAQLMKRCQHT